MWRQTSDKKEVKKLKQITNKPLPKIDPKVKIDTRIDAKTRDRLIEIAASKGKRHTSFIREILENYVKNYDL